MQSFSNSILTIFFLCPIPEDQKPITEYLELKQNSFFNWFFLSFDKKKLTFFFFFIFLIIFFFLFKNLKEIFFFFFFLFLFFVVLLFFTVKNICYHFENARLLYEEGSWYQGKIWEKPFSLIKNEKLIRIQKIEPKKKRLKGLLSFFFLF
jgi:hypothetical protein